MATRHELIELAKYWVKRAIDVEYFWFCSEQVGSSETRIRHFSWKRVERIAQLIGEAEVDQAVQEAIAEYGKDQDPRVWNIFRKGTPEEQKAFHEETARYFEEMSREASGAADSKSEEKITEK